MNSEWRCLSFVLKKSPKVVKYQSNTHLHQLHFQNCRSEFLSLLQFVMAIGGFPLSWFVGYKLVRKDPKSLSLSKFAIFNP